jgi:type I restriction enzyme M protein
VENEQAWRVPIDTIKAGNFNLDLKNPHSTDTGPGDVDTSCPNTKSSWPRSPRRAAS